MHDKNSFARLVVESTTLLCQFGARVNKFGMRWQAQRDTALDVEAAFRIIKIQSTVGASLRRRTPKVLALVP
jgi:hypothetical protein